ncbi:AAA family ATPase [Microcystis aeruginosa]|uniref:AAA family ATPase n=1 Tax=Microcystis aeruginosa TaxID=1126 RepID=UPI00211005B0|nr:AAA family ATPase [Microcystis aeruginosa]
MSVLGLSGIGKTTLVRHFVELNLENFEVVIWQNLKISNCLDTIITDIFTKINTDFILNNHDELTLFLKLLQQKKCLIIFDNVQELFSEGELAGQYQTKHKEYQKFFSIITNEIEHQSSLILISQERCSEMYYSDEKLDLLELQGLNNRAILNNLGLEDEESWLKLAQLYERNLSYLKDIAVLIKDVYHGCVSEFLQDENIAITAKIKESLATIIKRLSPIEKQIIQALSNLEKDCSRNELKSSLDLSGDDFIKGLQSLQKRYLLTKIQESEILFNLSPVFKKYIKDTGI